MITWASMDVLEVSAHRVLVVFRNEIYCPQLSVVHTVCKDDACPLYGHITLW